MWPNRSTSSWPERDNPDQTGRRYPWWAALSSRRLPDALLSCGYGEKLDAWRPFFLTAWLRAYWDGRILSLVRKPGNNDQQKGPEMKRKIRKQEFTLEDFMEQMQQ
jgi:signal recognition particle subunit SRP54